uniref:Glucose-6-phosphate exchanger SLC37A2 n=1 Tax=Suricata suricatta TaxID=37032 RepID=A0A673UR93_SURSU
MRSSLAPGVWFLRAFSRDSWFRGFILLLTFFIYTCYHMSRKPISVVKSRLHQNCSELIKPVNDSHSLNDTTWCDWAPFGRNRACCSSPLPSSPPQEEFVQGQRGLLTGAAKHLLSVSAVCFQTRITTRSYWGLWTTPSLWPMPSACLSAGFLGSGSPSVITFRLECCSVAFSPHSLAWDISGTSTCSGTLCSSRRGLIMGIWNSHTSVGNILGSLIAGVWVNEQWGLSFVVPGIITAAMGVITFLFLIEYPEDVDCTPPQHHMNDGLEENQHSPEDLASGPYTNKESSLETAAGCSKEPSAQPAAISFLGALRIPGVVEFSLCLLFAKLVSYTFLYWLPLYIFNVAHFSAKQAGDLSTLFDVGGIIGGIMAGLISDYTNGRATTCCVMLILAAPMMFLYNFIGQNGIINSIVMLIICGALVNGPYALITTAVSADLGTHQSLKGNAKALSTVTAIIDGTGSIGAALGPLLAGLISPTGWNNVFYMLISADILACLLLCRLVYKEILAWKSSLGRDRGYKEI